MASAMEFAIVTAGGHSAVRPYALRVEKPHAANDLRNRGRREPDHGSAPHAARNDCHVSQYETDASEPLWNGPKLRAPFVAQLLGQLLEGAETRSAQPGYGARSYRPRALLFDDTV